MIFRDRFCIRCTKIFKRTSKFNRICEKCNRNPMKKIPRMKEIVEEKIDLESLKQECSKCGYLYGISKKCPCCEYHRRIYG